MARKQVSTAMLGQVLVIVVVTVMQLVLGREVPQVLSQYEPAVGSAAAARFADNPLRLINQYYEMMKARRLEDAINELEQEEYQSEPLKPVDTSHLDSPPKPRAVENWPHESHEFGQVTAVSINRDGNPVIFHRGHRTWTAESFNATNHYQLIAEGPIEDSTILTLSAATGAVIDESGGGIFYMPHG